MKITRLVLQNFRLFSNFEIVFPKSNTIVIIGNNGSGKTSILDSIALCFTHLTGELLSRSEGYNIDSWFESKDVKYGSNNGRILIEFQNNLISSKKNKFDNTIKSIEVLKTIGEPGLRYHKKPIGFVKELKELLISNEINSIPIISYFNVNRTYLEDNKIKQKAIYNKKLGAYEYALNIYSPTFSEFEKWFIEQQRMENSIKVENQNLEFEIPSLKNVKKAFKTFTDFIEPGVFNELKLKTTSDIKPDFSEEVSEKLSVIKNSNIINFDQLSSGERMIISLVTEIARRLTIANENDENSLDKYGIVLIDEVELHIHPIWQKNIVKALQKTFPNIQFILTTHSPLVLSGVRRDSIMILENGEVVPTEELDDIYSGTADEIYEKYLNAGNSISDFDKEKQEIDLLFNSLQFAEAEEKLNELKLKVNSEPQWLGEYEQRLAFIKS